MARIFIDGFESGGTEQWAVSIASVTSSSFPTGFSGSYYLDLSSNTSYAEKALSSSKSELYFAFKYRPYSSSSTMSIILFSDSAGTAIASLARNVSTKFIEFRLGNYGALQTTGTIQLNTNSVYLIEIRYKPLNSGGICTVKVDGVQDINFSGDSTFGLENVQFFKIGYTGVNNVYSYCWIDDVVVDDASWIGNTKVVGLFPTAAGATGDFDCMIDSLVSGPTNGSATLQNCRTVLSASDLAHSGTQIRLRLRMQSMGGPTISGCSIGERSGSTDDFNGAPTRVTFNNGSNTRITTTSELVVSDLINFALDETKDYLVHLYFSVSQTWCAWSAALPTTRQSYISTGSADDTLTESVSYTSSAGNHFFVEAISVLKTDGASNYLTVDEKPASDYDYIFTNTENAIDTYAMGDLSGDVASIKAVAVQSRNWRVGNGSVNKIQHIVRPTSTDRVGASSGMIPISAAPVQTIWELNPDDSGVWEVADVNGMEAGIKAVT